MWCNSTRTPITSATAMACEHMLGKVRVEPVPVKLLNRPVCPRRAAGHSQDYSLEQPEHWRRRLTTHTSRWASGSLTRRTQRLEIICQEGNTVKVMAGCSWAQQRGRQTGWRHERLSRLNDCFLWLKQSGHDGHELAKPKQGERRGNFTTWNRNSCCHTMVYRLLVHE